MNIYTRMKEIKVSFQMHARKQFPAKLPTATTRIKLLNNNYNLNLINLILNEKLFLRAAPFSDANADRIKKL